MVGRLADATNLLSGKSIFRGLRGSISWASMSESFLAGGLLVPLPSPSGLLVDPLLKTLSLVKDHQRGVILVKCHHDYKVPS